MTSDGVEATSTHSPGVSPLRPTPLHDPARFFTLSLDLLCIAGADGYFQLLNPAWERVLGYALEELYVQPFVSFVHPDDREATLAEAAKLGQGAHSVSFENRYRCSDGSYKWLLWTSTAVPEANAIYAIARDITERKQAEIERQQLQEEVIRAQGAALRELSTPLIPIAEGVVVMPLIGALDSVRALQVIDTLLNGVSERRAQIAILDITGVSVVDTQVANGIIRAAQAVKLLGALVILTGIRPEVAQTLVQLGVDLGGIVTRGSLQDGIGYALKATARP